MTLMKQFSVCRLCLVFPASLLVLFAAFALATQSAAQVSKIAPGSASHKFESYQKIPLSFEANQGQSDPAEQFLARGAGYSIFLTKSGAVLALGNPAACKQRQSGTADERVSSNLARRSPGGCSQGELDVMQMTLAGASRASQAKVTGESQLPGTVNYFIGNNPTRWRTNLPTYARVRSSDVYPGVDLVYYGNQQQLEYDFVVAPGSDPAPIRLQFSGERELSILPQGDLILHGAHGDAVFHKPLLYQEKNGQRILVAGNFRRLSNSTVGFAVGSYDRTRTLVIDPVLVYSTYLGGSGETTSKGPAGDQGNGIVVDASGNAYVVGTTYSANFPVTSGAFQSQNKAVAAAQGSNVFVTKLNPAGTALIYSTFLGGSGTPNANGNGHAAGDFGYGIALDSSGNAYLTGITYSTDFPITCGALQTKNPSKSSYDPVAFITKLNTSGSALAYSTYLGGSGNNANLNQGDFSQSIAVDSSGAAFVTGYTWSPDFPTTDGAFQTANAGTGNDVSNAFITKLNPSGTALSYSTYVGGTGTTTAGDYGNGIAVDSSGNAYITGSTASANFPVTDGAFQSTLKGTMNAFVTKINSTGTDELYSTYLGGSTKDSAQSIAIDTSGDAYIAGTTGSGDFPTTEGVLEGSSVGQSVIFTQGNSAGFVAKLNPNGAELDYSTYLQGTGTTVSALAIDSKGNAYVAGSAPAAGAGDTTGFETTAGALTTPASTTTSAFLIKLNSTATLLNYATLLGGSATDGAVALALDSGGDAFVTGIAESSDFPTSSGAFQTTLPASTASNAFVSKFALGSEANQTTYPAPPTGLIPTSMTIVSQTYLCSVNDPGYIVFVTVSLNTQGVTGPPPTGLIWLTAAVVSGGNPVYGTWGGSTLVSMTGSSSEGPVDPSWSALYEGDGVYAQSTISGTATGPTNCDSQPFSVPALQAGASASKSLGALSSKQAGGKLQSGEPFAKGGSARASATVQGPKFTAPAILPIALAENALRSRSPNTQESGSTEACIAPTQTPLIVTLHPAQRVYGAANPNFAYTFSGLLSGQTVVVTPQTTATAVSPVGTYPVTATVTGPDAVNYFITVVPTMMTVSKAPLHISAKTVNSIYGHTPPQPTAYTLTGFVNGDTSRVVTGAPVLSTSVTTASPVGLYTIGVAVGTLSASNYYFETASNGMGVVAVYKAPLTIVARNEAVTYGQTPAQPTAYTLTGFLNGDTASVVSGAPALSTTVTSRTPVGFYRIGVEVGTLSAKNYDFLTYSNGMGAVGVYKAPLLITVTNLSMTQGGAVPPLTYTLTGFVNGDTAAGAVTGAAMLTTTATSASAPGNYPIVFSKGTLAAKNYAFTGEGNGVLRVLP